MRARSSVVILASVLCSAGCSGSVLAARRAERASAGAPTAALRLQWIEGNLRVLVDGSLRGTAVTWAVDTGAADHSVALGFARRLGIEGPRSARSVTIVGSGDRVIDAMTVPVDARVFSHDRAAPSALSTRSQPGLELAGVAGFVSPLRFERAGAMIELDLPARAMTALEADGAVRALARLRPISVALEDWDGGTPLALRTVSASLDGNPARLIVDTGAPSSFVFADSVAGADASMRTTHHGRIRWPDTDVAVVGRATMRVGRASVPLRRLTVHPRLDSGLDGVDGVLGLDVLRACVVLLDLRSGGAIACETPADSMDTAPALDQLAPLEPAPALRPRADPLDSATLAVVGCESVARASLAPWARERGLPADSSAGDAMVRATVIAHGLRAWGVSRASVARDDRVHALVAQQRARAGLLDQRAFEAALASRGESLDTLRATVADQLAEHWITQRVIALDPALRAGYERDPAATVDALVARMRDRLARVVLARDGARCEERWPSYWIEQIHWRGLDAAQTAVARRALARVLRGGQLELGATGVLAGSVREAITRALETPTRAVTVTVSDEGPPLVLQVTFAPRALSLRPRARRSS